MSIPGCGREVPAARMGWPNQRAGYSYPDKLLAVHMEMDKLAYRPNEPLHLNLHPLGLTPGDRIAVSVVGAARGDIHASMVQARTEDSTFQLVFTPDAHGWSPGVWRMSVSTPWGSTRIGCQMLP